MTDYPPPGFNIPLPEPSLPELRALRRIVQHRDHMTMLEQVVREVGVSVFTEMLPLMQERPALIRRGRIVGLPPGTYAILLHDIVRRRRAEASTEAVAPR